MVWRELKIFQVQSSTPGTSPLVDLPLSGWFQTPSSNEAAVFHGKPHTKTNTIC